MDWIWSASLWLGTLSYIGFCTFAGVNLFRGITGKAMLLAAILSLVWMLSLMLFGAGTAAALAAESAALSGWLLLLFRALDVPDERRRLRRNPLQLVGRGALVIAGSNTTLLLALTFGVISTTAWVALVTSVGILVSYISGLILIEQLARNSRTELQWRIRYLNIGLGLNFAFGTLLHGTQIAFGSDLQMFIVIQPAVAGLMVPFLCIASLRNRTNQLRFNLSRELAFRTGVLATTGSFLLALSLLAYLSQIFARDVGLTVAAFITVVGVGLLMVIIGSSQFRASLRVQLSKMFFAYRYDYREEWMRITRQLSEHNPDYSLAIQVQRSFLTLLFAQHSAIWLVKDEAFTYFSDFEAPQWSTGWPLEQQYALLAFMRESTWVIDLLDTPEHHQQLFSKLAESFPGLRFVVPLILNTQIYGVCLIGASSGLKEPLGWEDYDILKLQSRQATATLAFQAASEANVEHEKFAAVNQMSAFLVHDIKTIVAQLSLLVENSQRHRDKPEFIDDMFQTTANSVTRLQKIIRSLQASNASEELANVSLEQTIQDWQQATYPAEPRLQMSSKEPVALYTHAEGLLNAMNHVVQNALEVSGRNDPVAIVTHKDSQFAYIDITDSGPGMSPEFIANELFKPFRSAKGVTGMGIGAYQARETIRKLGGDMQVESTPGIGTTFRICVPLGQRPVTNQ